MSSKKERASERAARLAQAQAEAKRRERRRNIISMAGVAVLIVAIVVGGVVISKMRGNVEAPDTSAYGLVAGETDAPHSVIVYEDFLCPICGQFEAASRDAFAEQIQQGNLYVEYRPIVILDRFGPYSEAAANAFFVVREAAGDDIAKKYHDLLFENQPAESGPFDQYNADYFVKLAVEAGATEADVRPGIESNAKKADTEKATQEAVDAGVDGTPTILFDGEVQNGYATFEGLTADLVAKSQQ